MSHHLRVLRNAGLLRERRSGRWVYYSLDLDHLARVRAALTDLLAPTDTAAAACVCSDCGSLAIPLPATASPRGQLPLADGIAP